MAFDPALLHRVNREGIERSRAYRCSFVEAIKHGQMFRQDPWISSAIAILKSPACAERMVGERCRGEVRRWVRADRPPPYHYRPEVERANAVSGEFKAR